MAFRLGHQITSNLNKNIILRNSTKSATLSTVNAAADLEPNPIESSDDNEKNEKGSTSKKEVKPIVDDAKTTDKDLIKLIDKDQTKKTEFKLADLRISDGRKSETRMSESRLCDTRISESKITDMIKTESIKRPEIKKITDIFSQKPNKDTKESTNLLPKKREPFNTSTFQRYNSNRKKIKNSANSKQQLSPGAALIDRIMQISKENLFAVRNGMTPMKPGDLTNIKPPAPVQTEKEPQEIEPIKVKTGPKLKLQSWNLNEREENENALIPKTGEKFTVPWLSWSDRVRMKNELESKGDVLPPTKKTVVFPKTQNKEKPRIVAETQMRRYPSTDKSSSSNKCQI